MKLFNRVYQCDGCKHNILSLKEYLFNKHDNSHYCNDCYNSYFLLEGKCKQCNNSYKRLANKSKIKIKCDGGPHSVYLEQIG